MTDKLDLDPPDDLLRGQPDMREDGLSPPGRFVAVVGCDGAGKTRLVRDLVKGLRGTASVERRYMGLVSGESGDKIKQWPVVGVMLERYLAEKVRRAQDMRQKVPGAFAAVVIYGFSLWRVRQLRRLKERADSGVFIIAERYPQSEIPGFHYDGPGISADRSDSRFVRALARREQKLYERMARLRPALILRLVIDADTAYARKSDHPINELRDKTRAMELLKYGGADILEIDARLPYEDVLARALDAVERLARI